MHRALIVMMVVGCVPPQQGPAPSYYANGGGTGYANNGGYATNEYGETPPQQLAPQAPMRPPRERNIMINGVPLDDRTGATLAQLEANSPFPLPDGGRYWYDSVSGAFGIWGERATLWIGPGHALGPRVPANASAGTSGIFINGRQLQVVEAQGLSTLVAYPWQPGRYFIDATGNAGLEGGPVIVNILVRAQQVYSQNPQGGGGGGAAKSFNIGSGNNQGSFFSDGKCRYFQHKDGTVISTGC